MFSWVIRASEDSQSVLSYWKISPLTTPFLLSFTTEGTENAEGQDMERKSPQPLFTKQGLKTPLPPFEKGEPLNFLSLDGRGLR